MFLNRLQGLSIFTELLYYDIIITYTEIPTLQTFQQTELIAENLSKGINVYRFRWQLPANIENIDLKHIMFQVDRETPTILTNTSTEIILPLSHGEHSVNIIAVDRCNRQSQPIVVQLQVNKGEYSILKGIIL